MTVGYSAGFFTQGGGGSTSENELIASVPSGAVLTSIDVTGQMADESITAAVASGAFEALNLMTGLQWVTSGGSAVSITAVPVTSGNWLTFSEGYTVPPTPQFWVSGTSYVQYVVFGFKEHWRGQLDTGGAIDVYWSFGENTALSDTVGYRAFASYRVRWATYP